MKIQLIKDLELLEKKKRCLNDNIRMCDNYKKQLLETLEIVNKRIEITKQIIGDEEIK